MWPPLSSRHRIPRPSELDSCPLLLGHQSGLNSSCPRTTKPKFILGFPNRATYAFPALDTTSVCPERTPRSENNIRMLALYCGFPAGGQTVNLSELSSWHSHSWLCSHATCQSPARAAQHAFMFRGCFRLLVPRVEGSTVGYQLASIPAGHGQRAARHEFPSLRAAPLYPAQQLAQSFARFVQLGLRVSDRAPKDLGDLVVLVAMHVVEDEHRLVALR